MWEQQAVMARLGTSEEAARLRARMQSSSLLSDMQAFKVCVCVKSKVYCIYIYTQCICMEDILYIHTHVHVLTK